MYVVIQMEGKHEIESVDLLGTYKIKSEAIDAIKKASQEHRFFDLYYCTMDGKCILKKRDW